ncbi:MAG: phospholipase [Bacteroidaceae bacterium]|nr:phospholipase [Bacteroidaceae bacterium]MBQ9885121.1 phospholipase [Bacteroidaceae bacterium]
MYVLILSLILVGVVAAIAGSIRYKKLRQKVERGELEKMPEVKMVTDCGADSCAVEEGGLCELDCVLNGSKGIEYYDDEELDRFKGKEGDAYSEEEEAEFREIFETMLPKDVPGWVRSLQLREIQLPNAVKDEVFLVYNDEIHNS